MITILFGNLYEQEAIELSENAKDPLEGKTQDEIDTMEIDFLQSYLSNFCITKDPENTAKYKEAATKLKSSKRIIKDLDEIKKKVSDQDSNISRITHTENEKELFSNIVLKLNNIIGLMRPILETILTSNGFYVTKKSVEGASIINPLLDELSELIKGYSQEEKIAGYIAVFKDVLSSFEPNNIVISKKFRDNNSAYGLVVLHESAHLIDEIVGHRNTPVLEQMKATLGLTAKNNKLAYISKTDEMYAHSMELKFLCKLFGIRDTTRYDIKKDDLVRLKNKITQLPDDNPRKDTYLRRLIFSFDGSTSNEEYNPTLIINTLEENLNKIVIGDTNIINNTKHTG